MSLMRLPTIGTDLQAELTTTQFVIPAGAGATYAVSNNIATITTNAAHGLTFSPAAGTMPNYFVTFGGSTSGITGTGILVGNIFRILSIPTTTTFTIYCTITAATVTSMTTIPVFIPPFTTGIGSSFASPANQLPEAAMVYASLGANCALRYNPDLTALLLDGYTTPAAGTPSVAPTWRDVIAASGSGCVPLLPPYGAIWANGTTATSRVSVIA